MKEASYERSSIRRKVHQSVINAHCHVAFKKSHKSSPSGIHVEFSTVSTAMPPKKHPSLWMPQEQPFLSPFSLSSLAHYRYSYHCACCICVAVKESSIMEMPRRRRLCAARWAVSGGSNRVQQKVIRVIPNLILKCRFYCAFASTRVSTSETLLLDAQQLDLLRH